MSIRYTADQLQRKFQGSSESAAFARLAEGLRAEGRLDEAIQICQDGLRIRPYQLSGYLVLGKTLIDAGRLEDAREQFEGALRLDARCLSAMHSLAGIMNKLQWAEAAAGYYRSILEVEPWDEEIRALLGEPAAPNKYAPQAPASPAPAAPSPYEPKARQDYSPVRPEEEDTFHKPDGLAGDVMEINLNDALELLPGQDGGTTAFGDDEISLEDALALQTSETEPRTSPSPFMPAAPEIPHEPAPQDILRNVPPETEMHGSDEPAPISGQDVEDRLDSLFGPDEPVAPSSRSQGISSLAADVGDATTIHTGAMRLMDIPSGAETASAPVVEEEVFDVGEDRVSGEDIEDRLDALFSLTEEDKLPPAEGKPAFDAAKTGVFSSTETGTFSVSETGAFMPVAATGAETTSAEIPDDEPAQPELMTLPEAVVAEVPPMAQEDMVTGEDVADKLDDMFGADPETEERASAAVEPAESKEAERPAWSPAASEPADQNQAIMSTESMLPMGWLADAGDQPRITGADIEAQLDKLFDMEGESDAMDSGASATGNTQDPVTFEELSSTATEAAEPAPSQAMPGDESDRTVTMPAMKDSGLKESVSDWLAKQSAEGKVRPPMDAGDTMFMPSDEAGIMPDFDATLEMPASSGTATEDQETFGTLAPEDASGLSETASIEMIDGADVAERLDELFAGAETTGMEISQVDSDPLVTSDSLATGALETADSEAMVTGEEVSSRLSEIFETDAAPARDGVAEDMEVPFNLETVEETATQASIEAPHASASPAAASELAPMQDEEDGYPEEEEMPSQSAAGANVATVTLAEIYFQQGLKEQALQIYRQLLEREPENDSVRKRIEEIEASKSEGDKEDPNSDPRRPRPGLKVPKRKK
jgi:pilus assembly protein FimV